MPNRDLEPENSVAEIKRLQFLNAEIKPSTCGELKSKALSRMAMGLMPSAADMT